MSDLLHWLLKNLQQLEFNVEHTGRERSFKNQKMKQVAQPLQQLNAYLLPFARRTPIG